MGAKDWAGSCQPAKDRPKLSGGERREVNASAEHNGPVDVDIGR